MAELLILVVLVIAVGAFLVRRLLARTGRRCWNCGANLAGYDGYSCPNCLEIIEQGDEPDDDIDPDEHPNRGDRVYDDDDDLEDDDNDDEDRAVVRR